MSCGIVRLDHWLDFYVLPVLLFLFPLLILSIHGSYALLAGILVLLGLLLFPFCLHRASLDADNKKMLLFSLVFPVFLIFSYFIHGGYWSGIDYFLRWLFIVPLFFLFFKRTIDARAYGFGLVVGCILSGSIASWEYFVKDVVRVGEYIDNVGVYGQVAASLTLPLVVMIYYSYNRRFFYLYLLAAFLGSAAMVFSGTRGVLFGFAATLCILFFVKKGCSIKNTLKLSVFAIVLLMITSPFVVGQRFLNIKQEYVSYTQGHVGTSFGARAEMTKAAILLVKDHPFFGVGAGNYQSGVKDLIVEGLVDPAIASFGHAHNQYSHVMAEFGLLGLFAFLFSMIGMGYLFFRRASQRSGFAEVMAVTGGLLVVMNAVFSITQTPYSHNLSIVYYVITIFLCWHFSEKQYSNA